MSGIEALSRTSKFTSFPSPTSTEPRVLRSDLFHCSIEDDA